MTDLSAVESIFHAALERPTPEARALVPRCRVRRTRRSAGRSSGCSPPTPRSATS